MYAKSIKLHKTAEYGYKTKQADADNVPGMVPKE